MGHRPTVLAALILACGLFGQVDAGAGQAVDVPVEPAVYQGMGHYPSKPSQQIDVAERNLSWFERYLRGR